MSEKKQELPATTEVQPTRAGATVQFTARSGYISLSSRQEITFGSITQMAAASALTGVPASARILDIHIRSEYHSTGTEYIAEIRWDAR